eukprot:COSAG04_NODE_7164_length_1176_cov_1.100279_2_plen_77_part_01
MGGGDNEPPPWKWRDDPDRTQLAGAEITFPGRANPERLQYPADVLRRFRDTHDILKRALDELEALHQISVQLQCTIG